MDSYRGFDEDTAWTACADEEPAIERPPEIGVDERRMHVRAYNYWVSLLGGRPYPSIADLKPERIGDFGPHSVLLDFTGDADDPEITFLGTALRAECDLPPGAKRISQVPSRSLLSRLTDHYMQIIANRAPIGFEAEFLSQSGANMLYRGILMPLSTDGEDIDFIYGVINWKELADSAASLDLAGQVDRAFASAGAKSDCPVWADGPNAELPEAPDGEGEADAGVDPLTLSLWPDAADTSEPEPLAEDAELADRLGFARASAEQARNADHRSRASLYRALGDAYDFARAAESRPDDYADLLDDAGLKVQARAPMTPVVKLVFGAGYDKTRLTEFAAALSWARRHGLAAGNLATALEGFQGGLKGVVADERAARRPAPKPDQGAARRRLLQSAPALALIDGLGDSLSAGEFVLIVARAEPDGRLAVVAPAVRDARLVDAAIAKSLP